MLNLDEKVLRNFFVSLGITNYMLARTAAAPIMSPSLHYALSLFEGMSIIARKKRGKLDLGLYHPTLNFERLRLGAQRMGYAWPGFSDEQMVESIFTCCALNGWHKKIELKGKKVDVTTASGHCFQRIYVRPLLYSNNNAVGLGSPLEPELLLALAPMGAYLPSSPGKGISVMLYPHPRNIPFPNIKASGNYQLSVHARKMLEYFNSRNPEKCSEALFANSRGILTEGSGENVMMIKGDALLTPPLKEGILPGCTMRIIARIAEDMGMNFKFKSFKYADIKNADAFFFTGNAAGMVSIGRVVKVDSSFSPTGSAEVREGQENARFKELKKRYEDFEIGKETQKFGCALTYMDEWIEHPDQFHAIGEEIKDEMEEFAEKTVGDWRVGKILRYTPTDSVPRSFSTHKHEMQKNFGLERFFKLSEVFPPSFPRS
jgi:branched-chain amino acid aminotransferase